MKKKILLCALLAHASSALALSDAGSKYYIEAAMGVSGMHSGSYVWSGNGSPKSITFAGGGSGLAPIAGKGPIFVWNYGDGPVNSTPGGVGFAGSASIGYDHKFCNSLFVLGAFFGGGGTGAHCSIPYFGTASYTNITGIPGSGPQSSLRAAINLHDRGFFVLGARMGVALGPVFTFLRLGYAPHAVQCKIAHMGVVANEAGTDYTQAYQKKALSNWISTMLIGIGADINLTPRLILGLLAEGHFGGQRDFQFPSGYFTSRDGYTYDTPRVRSRPAFSQFLITFKYAMPSC